MEHLNSANLENFISFYDRFYSPNNATLSLAGDFDIPETKELIKAYFNDIPMGPSVVQPTIQEEPLGEEKTAIIYDDIQLPAIMLGYSNYYHLLVIIDLTYTLCSLLNAK